MKLADIYLHFMKISLHLFLINIPSRNTEKRNSKESHIMETKESYLSLRPKNKAMTYHKFISFIIHGIFPVLSATDIIARI